MDRTVHRASVPDLRSLQREPQAFALFLPQARDLSSLCRSLSLFLPCLLPLSAFLGGFRFFQALVKPSSPCLSIFPTPSSSGHFSLSTHHLIYSPTEPVPQLLFSLLMVKRHAEQPPCGKQACLDQPTQSKFLLQKQQCPREVVGVSRL